MDKWQIMIHDLAVAFAPRCRQEAEMQEQTFAAGECPVCGHDWSCHGEFIQKGEKTCVVFDGTGTHTFTFDPVIMDERHPYYVADAIASECDIADEVVAVIAIQYHEDDIILHTDALPFCGDEMCPCHADFEAIWCLKTQRLEGLLTADETTRLWQGRQV